MAVIGSPHHHYRSCDSTNARARDLAAAGARHGTIVTADEQTAGRGRQGRTWSAPAGKALLYSVVVRPLREGHSLLPLTSAIATCEAAEALAPISCTLKWPNDVWVDDRKVAGILVEARPAERWAVVGVGLNLSIASDEFPSDVRETAASIGSGASSREAAREMSGRLGSWLEAKSEDIIAEYRRRDALAGRLISWTDGQGHAAEIDDEGGLVVALGDGSRRTLSAGEVHLSVDR